MFTNNLALVVRHNVWALCATSPLGIKYSCAPLIPSLCLALTIQHRHNQQCLHTSPMEERPSSMLQLTGEDVY